MYHGGFWEWDLAQFCHSTSNSKNFPLELHELGNY